MSRESVWQQSGKDGGRGFHYRLSNMSTWVFQSWKNILTTVPTTREGKVALLKKWASENPTVYAMSQCSQCHAFHNGRWAGDLCDICGKQPMKSTATAPCKHTQWTMFKAVDPDTGAVTPAKMCTDCGYQWHVTCHMEDKKAMKNKLDWTAKPVLLKREEGDIWEIPASSSPLWTRQWGYQGSAKEPYIVSKKNKIDGGTSADGWACSCRAFTQHSPRKDCKHIINVKHQYGLGTVNPTKKAIANMDSDEAAAFAEFKRQQAQNAKQKPESGDADLALFGQTGRKFR